MSFYLRNSPYQSPAKRSVSPIQNLKQSGLQYATTTPPQSITIKKALQQSTVLSKDLSPQKVTEANLWKSRCNDLETSLCQANTDLEVANFKAKKARDLETRVELILKQNAQILSENDQLNKNLNQKKTEADIWKSKYEGQMNTIITLKANYELEIKKNQQENLRLKSLLDATCSDKYKEIEDTKGRMFVESVEKVEHLKFSHSKSVQLYEEQLRKLRETIDDRENEINELNYKLSNTRNDQEAEQIRLNQDRDRLRARIQQLEMELQRELEQQRNKIDLQFNEQIMSMKQLHQGELDTVESELRKLKVLIEAKNEEIQALIVQNKNQKNNFEAESRDLREEINALKEKISENNYIKEEETNELKEKLAHLHIKDTQDLKARHEALEHALHDENHKLSNLLHTKSEELDIQIKEKNKQRDNYNKENARLKEEIDTLRYRFSSLERERENQLNDAQTHLNKTNNTHEEFSVQLKDQIQFLENEISELKFQLVKKNNELDENISKSQAVKSALEEDLRAVRLENEELRRQLDEIDHDRAQIIADFKQRTLVSDGQHGERVRKLEAQIDFLDTELRRTREALSLKSEECQNHVAYRLQQESEIRKLKAEIDSLGEQIIYLERLKAKELEEQRTKLDQSNQYSEKTLRQSHQNQVNILTAESDRLKQIIDLKEREIDDMINKYEQIEKAFAAFSQNQQQLDDYEKKIQLMGSEIVTTKNLYDVFVRSKSRFTRK